MKDILNKAMMTSTLDVDPSSRSEPIEIQHAEQQLLKSCRVPTLDGKRQSPWFIEVRRACDELRNFTFHSENGRLLVIEKLTKLEGNFVVKVIRKGLLGLSKVYIDPETFEEESLRLIELCYSQFQSMQVGSEYGQPKATPAVINGWAVELCEELMKTKDNACPFPIGSKISLSNYLSTIKDLYELIFRARLQNKPDDTFKNLLDALIPRIHSEGFGELIELTADILRTQVGFEEKAEFHEGSSNESTKMVEQLLNKWVCILKFPFVTNWFALKTAKRDLFVHDENYNSIPCLLGNTMFLGSSISVVCTVLDQLADQNETVKDTGKKVMGFLLNLPKQLHETITDWIPLVKGLKTALPNTWDTKAYNFITKFVNKFIQKKDRNDSTRPSQEDSTNGKKENLKKFVLQLKDVDRTEEVKTEVLELGFELFEEILNSKEYELVLDVIINVATDMKMERIKQYVLHLSKAARANHCKELDYLVLVNAIRSISKMSIGIESKNELYQYHLQVVQSPNGDNTSDIITNCQMVLNFSCNTEIIKRFFNHAAAGRINICKLMLACMFFEKIKGILDETKINDHIIFLFKIIDETLKSGNSNDLLSRKDLEILFYDSNYEIILASLAGAITVGTFDSSVNVKALRILYVVTYRHQLVRPIDILALYIELNQIIRGAKFADRKEGLLDIYVIGLTLISKLPLTLVQLKRLMRTITTILNDENFTNEEVKYVMCHLFKMPDNFKTSSVSSSALASHFDKLVQPLAVRNVSKIAVFRKAEPNDSNLTVMELLCERTPKVFAEGTSVEFFRNIVEKPNVFFAAFTISVEMIKQYISDVEFEIDIDEMAEEVFQNHVEGIRVLFYAECLTECCVNGFNDKKRIIMFIKQIFDLLGYRNYSEAQLCEMINCGLQIPKQLTLAFRDALDLKSAVIGMKRVLDVVRKLEPWLMTEQFLKQFDKDSLENFHFFLQHDFHMLLKQHSLTSNDVYSSLQLYESPYLTDLLSILSLNGKERLADDSAWSTMYVQSNVLTPGKLAYVTTHHLKRLGLRKKEEATRICSKLLDNYKASKTCTCSSLQDGFEAYFALFVNILNGTSHFSEMQPWLTLSAHHAIQCKDVIIAACSWKAESKSSEEALQMNNKVLEMTSSFLEHKESSEANDPVCYKSLTEELDLITLIIEQNENTEFTNKLFELLQISSISSAVCLAIIVTWTDKDESLSLADIIKCLHQNQNSENDPKNLDKETKASLYILPLAAKAFPNSAGKIGSFLKRIIDTCKQNNSLDLTRIPEWCKKMKDAEYPLDVIESWCTSLVHFPNLSSRDIDAIVSLTPDTINFLSRETNDIAKCLFSEVAPQTWRKDDDNMYAENIKSFKLRLKLAKILQEFTSIGQKLKENPKLVEIIRDGIIELCCCLGDSKRSLYKIQDKILKELFIVFFDNEIGLDDESMSQLNYPKNLLDNLVTLFRRLARRTEVRPTVFSHIKTIVDKIRGYLSENSQDNEQVYEDVQRIIHEALLNLESNQDAMHTLQASGYNQNTTAENDLWNSSSIQMSSYVKRTEDILEQAGTRSTKVKIVWVNRLLESVTTCSEKIPGCYAPNGFRSEKPVICGISVDNRIITIYKGNTEIENAEVKLFPAGMVVFPIYKNSHPYDTEQLWAVFYKMLLDKRLVPKIFLSNVSPAFDWIKQFVTPETSRPLNIRFLSCCDVIPSSELENSFDYDPDIAIHRLHTESANSEMKELIILTQDKAAKLKFTDVKPPSRNTEIKEQIDEVVLQLQNDSRLQEMHPQSHDKILKRLMTPIRRAVEISVDGNDPTKEQISRSIDLKKLLGEDQSERRYSKNDYSVIIVDAVMKTRAGCKNEDESS